MIESKSDPSVETKNWLLDIISQLSINEDNKAKTQLVLNALEQINREEEKISNLKREFCSLVLGYSIGDTVVDKNGEKFIVKDFDPSRMLFLGQREKRDGSYMKKLQYFDQPPSTPSTLSKSN